MRKIALYCILAVLTCLTACQGKDWDTEDELTILTANWSQGFVEYTLDKAVEEDKNGGKYVITTVIKDTICREYHHYSNYEKDDSIDVVTKLYQFGDSNIVTVDGYRYSNRYFAHLYTIDSGIVNYDGVFHVDFYETGKTTPWAWGEVTYQKDTDKDSYHPYKHGDTKVGRY